MQIVIDINDNLYTRLFDNGDEYVTDMRRACVTIRKGTPLPKGHGRLIDADKFKQTLIELEWITNNPYEEGSFDEEIIDKAPTVIEADTERSEDAT